LCLSIDGKVAKKALGDSGIKLHPLPRPSQWAGAKGYKDRDTKYAVNEGADEVDMVISRENFMPANTILF
jgi:hypothetical protein